ncbi:MAG: hypothetical protein WCO56_21245 [Verrucomicrobiota bacterium]
MLLLLGLIILSAAAFGVILKQVISDQNPGVIQQTSGNQGTAFGPVIERVVQNEEAIDFDSGKQLQTPEFKLKKANDGMFAGMPEGVAILVAWMEQQGMDARFDASSLTAFGMKVKALTNTDSDRMSPAQWAEAVRSIDSMARPHVLLEPGTNQPATYAFQTREGGKGILQVIAFTDNGVKLRYKLVQGGATKAVTVAKPAAPLVFGPVTNGLQAAAEVTPDDPFQVHFHIRNVSKDTFTIASLNYRQDDECILTDEQGKPVEVERGFDLSYTFTKREMLVPGKTVVLASGGLSFLPGKARWYGPTFHAKAKPGRYTLRFRVSLDGNEPLDWKGTLETAPVTIEVKEPGVALQNYLERTLADLQETKIKQAALPSKPGLTDEERKAEAKELESQLKADEEEAARLRELVQKSATNAAAVKPAPAAVFGLQAERMIAATDANSDGVVAFRFENNFPFQPPVAVTGHFKDPAKIGFTPELRRWMQDENVDLLFYFDKKAYYVLSLNMRTGWAGQPKEWDTILPDCAVPQLTKMEKLNSEPTGPSIMGECGYRDGLGGVQVFRTRNGLVGFYQLRGLADADGRGVNIRYKLVQASAPKSASAPTVPVGAKISVTKEQVAHIEALLKKGPVTTDYPAALFEHDETSGSSYRQRADVASIAILPAEKSATESIPLGQVLHQFGGTAFYVQWDDVGASILDYYGPYIFPCEVATALGLSLTTGRSAKPEETPKPPVIADPLPAIEMKVAQQRLEKVLTEIQEARRQYELGPTESGLTQEQEKAWRDKAEGKLKYLENEATRLREQIAARASNAKSAASADALPAIELNVAQQRLEKVLGELLETQAALDNEGKKYRPTQPVMVELESKRQSLEQEAAQLRARIQPGTPKP